MAVNVFPTPSTKGAGIIAPASFGSVLAGLASNGKFTAPNLAGPSIYNIGAQAIATTFGSFSQPFNVNAITSNGKECYRVNNSLSASFATITATANVAGLRISNTFIPSTLTSLGRISMIKRLGSVWFVATNLDSTNTAANILYRGTSLGSLTQVLNTGGPFIRDIEWNGSNMYVIVTDTRNNYYTSPDGITWTGRALPVYPGTGQSTRNDGNIVYNGTQFVTFLMNPDNLGHRAFFTLNNDGTTWTRQTETGGPIVFTIRRVGTSSTFVAISDAAIWRSTDNGITWASTATAGGANHIAFSPTGSYFITHTNNLRYSATSAGNATTDFTIPTNLILSTIRTDGGLTRTLSASTLNWWGVWCVNNTWVFFGRNTTVENFVFWLTVPVGQEGDSSAWRFNPPLWSNNRGGNGRDWVQFIDGSFYVANETVGLTVSSSLEDTNGWSFIAHILSQTPDGPLS